MSILQLPGYLFLATKYLLDRCISYILKPLFKDTGRNLRFSADGIYTFSTISVGDDVYIGPGAYFTAKKGIKIENKIMFGPHVSLIGGNHNISKIGVYMADVTEKRPEDDLPIIIEDDVWVGARAIILKGVTVGRGPLLQPVRW